ncbi:MAG: hypothetical protein ACHQD9_09485 [Chitinophagales bacterium]
MNDNHTNLNAATAKRKLKKVFPFSIFFPAFLFLFCIQAFSQSHLQDVIQLKDGSIYRGLIKEESKDEIKLETGGNLIVIQRANVDTVYFKTETASRDYIFRQKQFGYFNVTTIGDAVGSKPADIYGNGGGTANGISAQTVHGYRFYSHYMAGAGAGVDVVGNPMLQFYADARYEPLKSQFTPYVFADLGYGIDLRGDDSTWYQKTSYSGGMMWGLGAGMRYNFKGVGAFVFDTEYKVMRRDEHISQYGSETFLNEYSLQRIVFRIGLAF